ncbi:hypothetical protein PSTG_11859 [Puccinia striiformis f. sp. tritici PST-78]|uniref:Uncharacterized protein n=1 Tax=Puccinia striiformis f. sp. tritici PST-78 TaxID=1165861 RepID=A0A0L0V6E4_9BASI|nr:hypothetical protein PSTG_11859 [Puccinia striiformis f. sp. tritici PST-78]
MLGKLAAFPPFFYVFSLPPFFYFFCTPCKSSGITRPRPCMFDQPLPANIDPPPASIRSNDSLHRSHSSRSIRSEGSQRHYPNDKMAKGLIL